MQVSAPIPIVASLTGIGSSTRALALLMTRNESTFTGTFPSHLEKVVRRWDPFTSRKDGDASSLLHYLV